MIKKKLSEILNPPVDEMAISKFQTIGDWNRRSSFGDVDRRLLTSPIAVEKIKRQWENTPFNFDMYLVNDPRVNKQMFREIGLVNMDFVRNQMRISPEEIPDPDENTITIIYTNNTGAERYMASGWILAHRLGHAIAASRNSTIGEMWGNIITILRRRIADVLKQVYNIDVYQNRFDFKGERDRETILKYVAQQIGTMKSARQNKMRSWYEFAYELLAQYLLNGQIKFNPLPQSLLTGYAPYGRKKTSTSKNEPEREQINLERLDSIAQEVQNDMEILLGATVGSVFVM